MEDTMNQPETVETPTASDLLAVMWEAAALKAEYPATTQVVSKLLRAGGGFDCSQDLLDGWARTHSVDDVTVGSRGFLWSPQNILQVAGLLNASRRWLLSSRNVHKMTGMELAELQARQVGQTVFDEIEEVSCRTLLGLISNPNTDPEIRAILCLALETKLQMAGIE